MALMNRVGLCCLLMVLGSSWAWAADEESPAELLQTLPDFKVEAVLQSEKGKIGSWISLAKDNKGRLLIAGQRKQPILRVTLKDGQVVEKEDLNLPLSEAMGMLYANDSLYMNASDGQKFGLFRLKDTDGQGHFATPELLREWKG